MLELDGADAFRLAAYRRAALRIRESAVPVAQLALDQKATRLSGIGSTIEGKIVEFTETGDLKALAKLRAKLPPGLVDVMHVPGLGPKTARKLWAELGVESLDDLRVAAEQERLRALPGLGAKTEEKILKELTAPARRSADDRAGPARTRAAGRSQGGGRDRGERAGRARLGGGERQAAGRDRARPRPHRHRGRPAGADGVLRRAPLGRRDRGPRPDEGDRRLARRPPLRPACRPAGELRQPAPALHGLEGPQRRVAGGRGQAGALGLRVRRARRRQRRDLPRRRRGGGLRPSRLRVDPAGAAREPRRARGRPRRDVARARRARETWRATCTCTRTGRTAAPRSRRWRPRPATSATATWPSATTRDGSGTGAWSGRPRRSPS